MIIRLDHLALVRGFSARPGLCRRGARQWFARHNMDWNEFRHHGIDSEALLTTGDPFAMAVVKAAMEHAEATDGRQ